MTIFHRNLAYTFLPCNFLREMMLLLALKYYFFSSSSTTTTTLLRHKKKKTDEEKDAKKRDETVIQSGKFLNKKRLHKRVRNRRIESSDRFPRKKT